MKKNKLKLCVKAAVLCASLLFAGTVTVTASQVRTQSVFSEDEDDEEKKDETEVYLVINSMAEFKEFAVNASKYDGKLVQLASDITFDGTVNNFSPIKDFNGTFDGCGHTISGIDMTDVAGDTGLFGNLEENGVIRNVTIENCYFSSSASSNFYDVGAIVGEAEGGQINNCHVRNTTVESKRYGYAGGICGDADYDYGRAVTIINCSSNADVKGMYSAGGICGYGYAVIKNCCNWGTVESTSTNKNLYAGGIIGYGMNTVQNCYNTGKITGNGKVGGTVGGSSGIVANCYCTEDYVNVAEQSTVKNNAYFSLSYMQSAEFLNLLNSNIGTNTDLIPWEFREGSLYPQHKKVTEMSNCAATLAGNFVYNGNAHTPKITVTCGAYTLKEGTDYKLLYSNNINAGTASVIARGQGLYSGDLKLDFTISKAQPIISYSQRYSKVYSEKGFWLNASVSPSEYELQYISSNQNVVSVEEDGYVSLNSAGIAKITMQVPESTNYNAASVTAIVTVKPSKQTASVAIKKDKIKILWSKDSTAQGYEVQYALDKKFTKSCKKATIKKKGKTSYLGNKMKKNKVYYARVRSYKTVTLDGNKTTLYGSWSKAAKIKRTKSSNSSSKKKTKYTYSKIDRTRKYKSSNNNYAKAEVYYKKVVLKGKSKAIKKINKDLAKECTKFLTSKSTKKFYKYIQDNAKRNFPGDFYYYANSSVVYNGNGIISIKIATDWMAGGVSNTDLYGFTYSLKTGKRLYITDVCESGFTQIKEQVKQEMRKANDSYYDDAYAKINNYKMKKMHFYVSSDDKVTVCFGPYELGSGGWYRSYSINRKR